MRGLASHSTRHSIAASHSELIDTGSTTSGYSVASESRGLALLADNVKLPLPLFLGS